METIQHFRTNHRPTNEQFKSELTKQGYKVKSIKSVVDWFDFIDMESVFECREYIVELES